MSLGVNVSLGPGDIVSDGDPAPLESGTTTAPSFRPMSIVAKRSPISATAEHLLLLNCCSYCDFVLERFTVVIGLYSTNSVQYYPCCHFMPCLLCGRTGVDSLNVFSLCLMRQKFRNFSGAQSLAFFLLGGEKNYPTAEQSYDHTHQSTL